MSNSCDLPDCSRQTPLSMRFSRQEHWSGLPLPSPGDLPGPGMEPGSPGAGQILYQLSYEGSFPILKIFLVSADINKLAIFIWFKEIYQHVEKLHITQNQYFPSGQCLMAKNHAWVQDPFKVPDRQMDVNLPEYGKRFKTIFQRRISARNGNT